MMCGLVTWEGCSRAIHSFIHSFIFQFFSFPIFLVSKKVFLLIFYLPGPPPPPPSHFLPGEANEAKYNIGYKMTQKQTNKQEQLKTNTNLLNICCTMVY